VEVEGGEGGNLDGPAGQGWAEIGTGTWFMPNDSDPRQHMAPSDLSFIVSETLKEIKEVTQRDISVEEGLRGAELMLFECAGEATSSRPEGEATGLPLFLTVTTHTLPEHYKSTH
jgi:hypothetical protein